MWQISTNPQKISKNVTNFNKISTKCDKSRQIPQKDLKTLQISTKTQQKCDKSQQISTKYVKTLQISTKSPQNVTNLNKSPKNI